MQIKKLYECIKQILPEREQKVIEMRYGISNGYEMTQKEIADVLGVSQVQVSRLESKILNKLRDKIKSN